MNSGKVGETCGNCRFWMQRSDHTAEMGGGYCRRYPPFFPAALRVYENMLRNVNAEHSFEIGLSSGFLNDAWPNMHRQSWCGEHSPIQDERR